ncbi:hypothetical protein PINS_up008374 [Pythium insidiosum]|nr:hypothetical protein PINS_up008374 [Pythium insidiosum]
MTTLASHVLVVFLDTRDAAPTDVAAALDHVSKQGCSGFLTLSDDSINASTHRALYELLAVNENSPFAFLKMPSTFFSTSKQAIDLVRDRGITDAELLAVGDASSAAETRLRSLLQENKRFVFVHLTEFLSTQSWLGDVLRDATRDDCFVTVVRHAERPHVDVVSHPLRPRQSFERHNGAYPARSSSPSRLFFSSFHSDRTRCDAVASFQEHDMEQHGAYGTMDARILIKELAFRLGFAPKYGA